MWLINQKFLLGVAGVVVDERGFVLLLRHTYRPRYPWGLPSGWVKRREQPHEALLREIHEETRLKAEICRIVDLQIRPAFPVLEVVYLCRPGPLQELLLLDPEVDEALFFRPGDFPAGLLPQQRPVIERALRDLPKPGTASL